MSILGKNKLYLLRQKMSEKGSVFLEDFIRIRKKNLFSINFKLFLMKIGFSLIDFDVIYIKMSSSDIYLRSKYNLLLPNILTRSS